jgi:hypothetical protein
MDPIDEELLRHKYRLDIKNDWERRTYLYKKKEIEPRSIKTVRISDRVYPVSWELERIHYDDMGRDYFSDTWRGYVLEPTFKTKVCIDVLRSNRQPIYIDKNAVKFIE